MRLRLLSAICLVLAGPVAGNAWARSPRTGDLATAFAVGLDGAVHDDDFDSGVVGAISQEFYWSSANAIRGTIGNLNLPARDGGRVSAVYLTASVSHNWLRGRVFPYVVGGLGVYSVEESNTTGGARDSFEAGLNGGVGMEVRLAEAVMFRLEAGVHLLTGEAPNAVATGTAGFAFYY